MPAALEFLAMRRVVEMTGISKSEIYRQIAAGRFPAGRNYKNNPHRKFWVSTEVVAWQREQVGDDFDALLVA